MYLNSNSVISYQPLWSKSCLINSKGGWDPNSSFLGILRSSINTNAFLLFSDQCTLNFLRFNLGKIVDNMLEIPVWALKLSFIVIYLREGKEFINVSHVIVFPVPVSPQLITCMWQLRSVLFTVSYFVDSSVGMMSSSNAKLGIFNAGVNLSHKTQQFSFKSTV